MRYSVVDNNDAIITSLCWLFELPPPALHFTIAIDERETTESSSRVYRRKRVIEMKITTCMYTALLLLLCLPPVYALRGLQNDYPVLACEIRIAHFMQEETFTPDKDMEEDQIACVVDNIIYNIPREILDEYDSELKAPGPKKMLIAGGSLPKSRYTGNDDVPEIVCPQDASVIIISDDRRSRNLQEGVGKQRKQGVSNVLVMRVVANDVSTTMSPEILHERIFGDGSNVENSDGGDSATLRQTYLDCSNGKLSFEPATGYDIEHGVGFVEIDMTVRGASNRVVENKVTEAINEKYGSVDDWDHIIYCLPKGTDKGWVAFGYGDWYRSVYNDEWCGQNSALSHEVGHNIGLQHSNEGRKYGDQTCMVGYSYDWVGGPRMCFNAHKNWITGWYSDKTMEIHPGAAPWGGTLVGFVDYDSANDNEYILIRFLDVYMQYNRAKTFNRQVREKPDELVIVQAEAEDQASELLGGLKEGEVLEYQGYSIKVCDVGAGPGQDAIHVSVYLSTESDVCGQNTGPQSRPSFAPTLGTTTPPTRAPIIPITPIPTEVASTPMPTEKTSAPQSSSPTRAPTPAPSPSPFMLSPFSIDDSCDDTAGEFYVSSLPGYERCVWLKARPEYAQILCEEGHESGAREVCPETCGACTDTCVDDMKADVVIDGVNRDCPWLDLRPEEIEKECKLGTDAWNYCRETCGNCNPFPTASPSATPSTSNPTATPFPTEKNPHDACDDDRFATFYVNETDKPEPCRWLWTRPEMRQIYCDPSHSAGAYDLCEETCEKCSDDCVDDPSKMVDINSVDRSCFYISMRNELIEKYCVEGEEAFMYCRETCNSCLPPTNA